MYRERVSIDGGIMMFRESIWFLLDLHCGPTVLTHTNTHLPPSYTLFIHTHTHFLSVDMQYSIYTNTSTSLPHTHTTHTLFCINTHICCQGGGGLYSLNPILFPRSLITSYTLSDFSWLLFIHHQIHFWTVFRRCALSMKTR